VTGSIPEKSQHSQRDLVRVVHWSSAFSLGTLAALLYSMKRVVPRIEFQISWVTVVAFALAAAASVAFWHVVFSLQQEHPGPQGARKTWLGVLGIGLGLALIFAFAYPLKDFAREKQLEIGFGAMIAVLFLTVLGALFWKVVQYLEKA
jgi:hypothetical protein